MNCLSCHKTLEGRQKKYCSSKCQQRYWRTQNPEYVKRYGIVEYKKKWRKERREIYLKQRKRNAETDRKRNAQHYKVRQQTILKYGKPPKGYEYHHTTEPYNVDEWILVTPKEHRLLHRRVV